jgi:peptide/nickel transport system substrate-binding protein
VDLDAVTTWTGDQMRQLRFAAGLALVGAQLAAQQATADRTVTIVIGAEPTQPVPTVSNFQANVEVASLLFLHLARLGKSQSTVDERAFEPELARRWTRRDARTLVFELDPRARWHDGVPVTSRDVVWSLDRARDSTIAPTYALLLRRIADVAADGPGRVVVRFKEAYPEQLYDAVWHAPPLPAHLLDTIPPGQLPKSSFVSRPIGNGPFRWGRLDPGQKVELLANRDFFLGAPGLDRVIFLLVRSADAQINAVRSGTADVFQGLMLARDVGPLSADPNLRTIPIPSYAFGFLLFNHRANGDRSKPHPILGDVEVRRALSMALDRQTLVRAAFGPYAIVPDGPMGQASWIRRDAPRAPGYDPKAARALLARRGWTDSDGDGVLDRGGVRLRLRLNYPATSLPRSTLAEPIQQMFRAVGVDLELVRLDGPIWFERRVKGEFDIDFSQSTLDPTPSGLVQSWTCGAIGGSNVASVCHPPFDSALAEATATVGDPSRSWRRALSLLLDDAPAIFLFAPAQVAVVAARFKNVGFRPEAVWTDLWRWSADRGPAGNGR